MLNWLFNRTSTITSREQLVIDDDNRLARARKSYVKHEEALVGLAETERYSQPQTIRMF